MSQKIVIICGVKFYELQCDWLHIVFDTSIYFGNDGLNATQMMTVTYTAGKSLKKRAGGGSQT
jgi:hypothetical protein